MLKRDMPFYLPPADGRQESEAARETLELREVLESAAGRGVFGRILTAAGVLGGIDKTSADVYRQTAVQAFGLRLLQEMYGAHPTAAAQIIDHIMRERIGNGQE